MMMSAPDWESAETTCCHAAQIVFLYFLGLISEWVCHHVAAHGHAAMEAVMLTEVKCVTEYEWIL